MINEQQDRDIITIEDQNGNQTEFAVEGIFDMKENSYALLRSDDETVLMRIEEEGTDQYLIKVSDPEERDSILDAYQVAVETVSNENENNQ